MRKNYNPLKMWGSYLGLFLAGILSTTYSLITIYGNHDLAKYFLIPLLPISGLYNSLLSVPLFSSSIVLIYGFLVGWGIHSLIRSLKK